VVGPMGGGRAVQKRTAGNADTNVKLAYNYKVATFPNQRAVRAWAGSQKVQGHRAQYCSTGPSVGHTSRSAPEVGASRVAHWWSMSHLTGLHPFFSLWILIVPDCVERDPGGS